MPTPRKDRIPVITAKDEAEFVFLLSFFAFQCFLQHGRGVVLLKRKQMVKRKSGIRCEVDYHPLKLNTENWDAEALKMVEDYDPGNEVILDIMEPDGSGRYSLSQPRDTASRPREAYRTALKEAGHVPIVPGTVVRLKPGAGFVPGLYVFVGHEKTTMRLIKTVVRDGRTGLTDQGILLHVDFMEMMEETQENAWELVRDRFLSPEQSMQVESGTNAEAGPR